MLIYPMLVTWGVEQGLGSVQRLEYFMHTDYFSKYVHSKTQLIKIWMEKMFVALIIIIS